MASLNNGPTTDFLAVGEAWKQSNADNYVWTKLPRVKVKARRSGRSRTTTYDLPKVETFLSDGDAGQRWEIGDSTPQTRDIFDVDAVSVTVKGWATKGVPIIKPATGEKSRFADAERFLPGMMAEAYLNRERGLVATLTATANYGAAKPFTGTQTLKLRDVTGDQQPIHDIEDQLEALRDVKGANDLKLYAFFTSRMANYLRRHPHYHGAGVGSNRQSALGLSEFMARFMDTHEVDAAFTFNTAWNSARRGKTPSIKRHGRTASNNAFLSLVLVDARQNVFDLTEVTDAASANPDGGLVLAEEVEPYHTFEASDNREAETHMVKDAFAYLNPRANSGISFGVWFGTNIE